MDDGGDGRERIAQLVEEHSVRFISCFACQLERVDMALGYRLRFSPDANVTNVALDHFIGTDPIDVADEFDVNLFSVPSLQRKIFITIVFILLKFLES